MSLLRRDAEPVTEAHHLLAAACLVVDIPRPPPNHARSAIEGQFAKGVRQANSKNRREPSAIGPCVPQRRLDTLPTSEGRLSPEAGVLVAITSLPAETTRTA